MCIVNQLEWEHRMYLPQFNATKVTQNKHENVIRFLFTSIAKGKTLISQLLRNKRICFAPLLMDFIVFYHLMARIYGKYVPFYS